MADKKSTDKSPRLFRPASPDSLSKKLKKCKTRKERQMAVFNDNFEREERHRMERALLKAIIKACSTPEKEEKQEEKPSENSSEEKQTVKKRLFKKK